MGNPTTWARFWSIWLSVLVFTTFVAVSWLFPCTTIGPVPNHNRASFPKEPSYCYTSLLSFHGRTPFRNFLSCLNSSTLYLLKWVASTPAWSFTFRKFRGEKLKAQILIHFCADYGHFEHIYLNEPKLYPCRKWAQNIKYNSANALPPWTPKWTKLMIGNWWIVGQPVTALPCSFCDVHWTG